MKLVELRLLNFRQHADTRITFRPGLTGIIGANGAGKSTLLEAIAWAIYGSEAARGTNDTLRFSRAPARARVLVELRFGLGGHEYRVVRTPSAAEVFLDGGAEPVATSVGGVTRYLQSRLGMTRKEFFNTYFTGQKELQFLATMGPTERGRFLSTVLGYERLRQAQDLVRTRRSELRHEMEGLRSGLGEVELLEVELRGAESQMLDARTALSAAEGEHRLANAATSILLPRWQRAEEARERFRQLTGELETADREREAASREADRARAEIQRVERAEVELATLREALQPLQEVREQCERFSLLSRANERRAALLEQVAETESELARSAERLTVVERAPSLLDRFRTELGDLREQRLTLVGQREERNGKWLEDRQDARTKLVSYGDRSTELREQVALIRDAGPAGICPTCRRPLGDQFERLLGELEDQLALSIQDEKWWAAREKQLSERPDELIALDRRLQELDRGIDVLARKLSRCEAGVAELRTLQAERTARQQRLTAVQASLEGLPGDYDETAHDAAEQRLRSLHDLETQAARLEEIASRRGALETELATAGEAESFAARRAEEALLTRTSLAFTDAEFAALRQEVETANDRAHLAEIRVTELRGRVETAQGRREVATQSLERYREQARELQARELALRHHSELDAAFTRLRSELNARVRPELSETASLFLAQLTDGRYSSLEIDDAYNILVLDEGEEKPVISGGEEDVANLVLRLSLSQMIAERAGHPLSLLVLDEVFGSLDVARRDNVVQLLRRLHDRFEQVILITHIDEIRESLDQVISVSFDERSGSAVVIEEPRAGGGHRSDGIAAD